jgi:hypothetical protein
MLFCGTQIMREAPACPNTELVGIADIYIKRLEDERAIAPGAKTYLDSRAVPGAFRYPAGARGGPRHACAHSDAGRQALAELGYRGGRSHLRIGAQTDRLPLP